MVVGDGVVGMMMGVVVGVANVAGVAYDGDSVFVGNVCSVGDSAVIVVVVILVFLGNGVGGVVDDVATVTCVGGGGGGRVVVV